MVQKDLILDFNLYLCEKFGYRESCSVMSHANGFCVDIRERDLDLARFFKEYMPRYGYKYLCTEDDDHKYYQTLGLKCIMDGFCPNYALALKDLNV